MKQGQRICRKTDTKYDITTDIKEDDKYRVRRRKKTGGDN